MMNRLLVPLVALFVVSLTGCCSVFGLCASASVHTSIASPQTFVQQDKLQGIAQPFSIARAPVQATTCSDWDQKRAVWTVSREGWRSHPFRDFSQRRGQRSDSTV